MPTSENAGTAEDEESVRLQFREGSSDKEYIVSLERSGSGWVVNFAYGRRGSTLRPGTKTPKGPTDRASAKKLYDKIVRGQIADGYRETGGGGAYTAGPDGKESSGIQVHLLTPVDGYEALRLEADPEWVAQQKHDGRRMTVIRRGTAVRASNRKGLYVGFPQSVKTAAESIPGDWVIDGEAVGERLHAFDVLEAGGTDVRGLPVEERLVILYRLLDGVPTDGIVPVATARTAEEKSSLRRHLIAEGHEGIVYKRLGAPYTAGKPGSQVKYKFYETASFVVDACNDQRSVGLRLRGVDTWVPVGNCTIPVNHEVPLPGAVVEVRYLYAYEGGGLAQPTYLGPRDDIDEGECITDQLKYKPT